MRRSIHGRSAAALAAILLVSLSAAATASAIPSNGPIVFVRYAGAAEDDHSAQLFVRSPSGAERQITHVPGGAFDPEWSPDGAHIVFERWSARQRQPDQLYTVGADGSGLHALASGCAKATGCLSDDDPSWSPDGTQIAFVRYALPLVTVGHEEIPSAADLMLVPATGGVPRVLRHFAGDPLPGHPAWSPDGRLLVLALSTAKQPTPRAPIVDALHVLDIASGASTQITPYALGASDPDWSPDAGRIVFSSEAGHSQFAYVVRPDGTGLRKIVHRARNHSSHPDDRRRVDARTLRPRWSPDGRRIVFASDVAACSSRHIGGCPRGEDRLGIFVMNADGSRARRVTRGRRAESSPDWAPAG